MRSARLAWAVCLTLVGVFVLLLPLRANAQEAGWVLTYAEGSGDNGTGPQELTWTCPVSGTGAGTVLESDPGNTLTDGTYTDLQVDSGCEPEVGQTLMWGLWTAEIVSVTDPTPSSTTTTTSTTSTTTTTTGPPATWNAEQISTLVESSRTTAGAVRVIGTLAVMGLILAVWRAYRVRH